MFTKEVLASIAVTCLLAASIYSCSGNSTVGAGSEKAERTIPAICEHGAIGFGISSRVVYVVGIDDEEKMVAVRIYDSITDLDFPLSIHQIEMIAAGEILELTSPDAVSHIVVSTFGSQLSPEGSSICTIGIIYTDREVLGVSWSCLKACVFADDYNECIRQCEGKTKDDGRSIYFMF
jgi:hypothetical protein